MTSFGLRAGLGGQPRHSVMAPGLTNRLRGVGVRMAVGPAGVAWLMLCALSVGPMDLQLCLTPAPGGTAAFDQALSLQWFTFDPAGAALEWALMVVAMMLPLVAADLDHLNARAFRKDAMRSVSAFLTGFLGLWLMLGPPVIALTLLGRAGLQSFGQIAAAPMIPLALAALWITSAAYLRTLRWCHFRPVLPANGPPLTRGAFRYGLSNAAACAASCLPLMLAMQVAGGGLAGMALIAVLITAARRAHRPNPKGAAAILLAYGILLTLI